MLILLPLGSDVDTVCAVYGQLAGALYGYKNIPDRWMASLQGRGTLIAAFDTLAQKATQWILMYPAIHVHFACLDYVVNMIHPLFYCTTAIKVVPVHASKVQYDSVSWLGVDALMATSRMALSHPLRCLFVADPRESDHNTLDRAEEPELQNGRIVFWIRPETNTQHWLRRWLLYKRGFFSKYQELRRTILRDRDPPHRRYCQSAEENGLLCRRFLAQ